jgi:hypothetical protein
MVISKKKIWPRASTDSKGSNWNYCTCLICILSLQCAETEKLSATKNEKKIDSFPLQGGNLKLNFLGKKIGFIVWQVLIDLNPFL